MLLSIGESHCNLYLFFLRNIGSFSGNIFVGFVEAGVWVTGVMLVFSLFFGQCLGLIFVVVPVVDRWLILAGGCLFR